MDDNKIYAKTMYKCGVCGNTYEELEDRVACESACLKKKKAEAAREKALKYEAEKKKHYEDTVDACRKAEDMIHEHMKQYGEFNLPSTMSFSELFSYIFPWM